MGVCIFATSVQAIWLHLVNLKVCTPISWYTVCARSFIYASKTFGNQLSIYSQVALNPGSWC